MRIDQIRDNVFHDNAGFGFYVNRANLLKTEIDPVNGFVSDWKTACGWNFETGEDHVVPGVVENHVEYGNNFGMGTYDLSDFSCRNCSLLANLNGIYWKTYSRSKNSPPMLEGGRVWAISGASWTSGGRDNGAVNGLRLPGGQALVEFKDVEIVGPIKLDFNHHCNKGEETTGAMCASSYFFNNVTNPGNWKVEYKDDLEGDFDSAMVFQNGSDPATDKTLLLGSSVTSRLFDPLEVNCSASPGQDGDRQRYWCPGHLKIRPLLLYSPHRGNLRITSTHPADNNGEPRVTTVPPRHKNAAHGARFGVHYCPHGRNSANGYTMQVLDGAILEIEIFDGPQPFKHGAAEPFSYTETWPDYFVMWYSEEQWPVQLRSSINVTVKGEGAVTYGLDGGPYVIKSDHDRTFMTPAGAYVSEAGAWWHAKLEHGSTDTWSRLPTFLDKKTYEEQRASFIVRQSTAS